MKVVDLNVLLYAVNRESPYHDKARTWIQDVLNGEEAVGLAWIVILGFLRITTRPGVFLKPLTAEDATTVVDGWLKRPCVALLHPGERHWEILRAMVHEAGTAGNLTTDAHLAAIAIEYGAKLYSTDNDFARFGRQLQYANPLTT